MPIRTLLMRLLVLVVERGSKFCLAALWCSGLQVVCVSNGSFRLLNGFMGFYCVSCFAVYRLEYFLSGRRTSKPYIMSIFSCIFLEL